MAQSVTKIVWNNLSTSCLVAGFLLDSIFKKKKWEPYVPYVYILTLEWCEEVPRGVVFYCQKLRCYHCIVQSCSFCHVDSSNNKNFVKKSSKLA